MGSTAPAPGPLGLARVWPQLAERGSDRPAGPDLADWIVAVACFAAFTIPVLPAAAAAHQLAAAAALGALAAAPLVIRRRFPVPVLLAVIAVYLAAALAGVSFTPFISNAGPSLAVAVFTAADRCPRAWSLSTTLAAIAVPWAASPLASHLHPQRGQDLVEVIIVPAAWVMGDLVRSLRGYRRQVQLLQRQQAAEDIRLVRAEERVRLSREVHDVVSHSLSAIAVQAGAAAGPRGAARPGRNRARGHRDGQPVRAGRAAPAAAAAPRARGHRRRGHADPGRPARAYRAAAQRRAGRDQPDRRTAAAVPAGPGRSRP